MSIGPAIDNHPCFNINAKGTCGRVHLPVARNCNIKCNYCNRKYDCVNESRPGVSSAVLTPAQAVDYLDRVLERAPHITVAGIAGPGDAFAEPETTLETLRLIRERYPDLLLCLATNGLNLPAHVEELARLNVTHVTLTVNAVDPEIGAKIYAWIRDGKRVLRKREAAERLLERQLEGIRLLKEKGIIVKVNTIVIPGVNDHHVERVARRMADYSVDIQNCMKMYPTEGAPFENMPEPTTEEVARLQAQANEHLPQMTHCTRCRADAIGLLDDDKSSEFQGCLSSCSNTAPKTTPEDRPYVAVASLEGMLVNQHLGQADRFLIWGREDGGFRLVEERTAPPAGSGDKRWLALAEALQDCRAVLISGIGDKPRRILESKRIHPVEMNGFINRGLEAVFNNTDLAHLKARRTKTVKACCSGDGAGCG